MSINSLRHFLALAVSVAAFTQAACGGSVTTGFLLPNAFLDDNAAGDPLAPADGVNWVFNSPWQLDPGISGGAALFVTGSTNPTGFFAAEASLVDLASEPNVLALDGYDPSTTRLTSLTFADPWRIAHFGSVPADGEYNYFIEFTIETPGGFYRAATQKIDRSIAFQNFTTQLGLVFEWQSGGFLGDPFAAGGIPIGDISDVSYNVLVEVVTPTTAGSGFFLVEGFNVEYEVTSIPEPTTFGLAGILGALASGVRRRRR